MKIENNINKNSNVIDKEYYSTLNQAISVYNKDICLSDTKLGTLETKILNKILVKINNVDSLTLSKIELLFLLNFLDYINKFILQFHDDLTSDMNKTFFKMSSKFFSQYKREDEDFIQKWSDYKKFVSYSMDTKYD